MNVKIMMSHDLTCVIGELGVAARLYANLPASRDRALVKLTTAAIAFTIQLAIEGGQDSIAMRALERDLIAAVTGEEKHVQ